MSRFYLKPVDGSKYNREIGPYPTSKMAEHMGWHYEKIYGTVFKVIEKDE